jgi:hypothetical protein
MYQNINDDAENLGTQTNLFSNHEIENYTLKPKDGVSPTTKMIQEKQGQLNYCHNMQEVNPIIQVKTWTNSLIPTTNQM